MAFQGKQCPRCLRHTHEHFFAEKKGKKWQIDRCANKECHYGYEIEDFVGSDYLFRTKIDEQAG